MNLHEKNKWLAFGAALALAAALTACGSDDDEDAPYEEPPYQDPEAAEWMSATYRLDDLRTEHIENTTDGSYSLYLMTYNQNAADDRIIYNEDDGLPDIVIEEYADQPESGYADVVILIGGPAGEVDANSYGWYWFGDDEANYDTFYNGEVFRIGEGVLVDDGGEKNQILHLQYDAQDGYSYIADYQIRKTYSTEPMPIGVDAAGADAAAAAGARRIVTETVTAPVKLPNANGAAEPEARRIVNAPAEPAE